VHDSVSCANHWANYAGSIPPFPRARSTRHSHTLQFAFTCLHPPHRLLPSLPQPRRAQHTNFLPLRDAPPPPPRAPLISPSCAITCVLVQNVSSIVSGFRNQQQQPLFSSRKQCQELGASSSSIGGSYNTREKQQQQHHKLGRDNFSDIQRFIHSYHISFTYTHTQMHTRTRSLFHDQAHLITITCKRTPALQITRSHDRTIARSRDRNGEIAIMIVQVSSTKVAYPADRLPRPARWGTSR
jgi:hypothetical protein